MWELSVNTVLETSDSADNARSTTARSDIMNCSMRGLARKLGLKGVSEEIVVTTPGGGRMITSKMVKVVVTTPGGERITLQAWTVPKVCDPLPRIDWRREKAKGKHLAVLPLKVTGGKIEFLLTTWIQ